MHKVSRLKIKKNVYCGRTGWVCIQRKLESPWWCPSNSQQEMKRHKREGQRLMGEVRQCGDVLKKSRAWGCSGTGTWWQVRLSRRSVFDIIVQDQIECWVFFRKNTFRAFLEFISSLCDVVKMKMVQRGFLQMSYKYCTLFHLLLKCSLIFGVRHVVVILVCCWRDPVIPQHSEDEQLDPPHL